MKQFGWQVVGLFHARDAATGKARSPRVDCCTDGTTSVMVVEERRWRRMLVVVRGLNAVQMISDFQRLPSSTSSSHAAVDRHTRLPQNCRGPPAIKQHHCCQPLQLTIIHTASFQSHFKILLIWFEHNKFNSVIFINKKQKQKSAKTKNYMQTLMKTIMKTTRIALSRVHISNKAAHPARFLLLSKHRVKHTVQWG